MSARPKRYLRLETTWLREYARTYMPSDVAFAFSPADLRRAGVTLVDLRWLFGFGVVEFADKLDGPGAFWVVTGEDCNGNSLRAEVRVVSELLSVKLLHIAKRNGGKDRSNDAA